MCDAIVLTKGSEKDEKHETSEQTSKLAQGVRKCSRMGNG